MPGEFTMQCQGCKRDIVVVRPPRCPQCALDAMLCEACMPTHNCDEAKADYQARLVSG